MKQFLLILFIISAPYRLFAQQRITITGGAAETFMISQSKSPALNPAFGLGYHITKNRTIFAIHIDAYSLSGILSYSGSDKVKKIVCFSPAIMPSVSIGTFADLNKSKIFFGLDMGAALALDGNGIPRNENVAYGFIFGAHIGYAHPISKNINIVAQIAPRYIGFLNIDHQSAFAVPLSVGLSFAI